MDDWVLAFKLDFGRLRKLSCVGFGIVDYGRVAATTKLEVPESSDPSDTFESVRAGP